MTLTPDEEIALLRKCLLSTMWLARRYADNRRSYAVSMYNDAAMALIDAGLGKECVGTLDTIRADFNTVFAEDGDLGWPRGIKSDSEWHIPKRCDGK